MQLVQKKNLLTIYEHELDSPFIEVELKTKNKVH